MMKKCPGNARVKTKAKTVRSKTMVYGMVLALIMLLGLACLRRVARWALELNQGAQFTHTESALELFNNEFDDYPPSEANDLMGRPYCGAMKLAEALYGQDMMGFHPASRYAADGTDAQGTELYFLPQEAQTQRTANLKARKGPLLGLDRWKVQALVESYGRDKLGGFTPRSPVICDMFRNQLPVSKSAGMPVLYYRAC